MSGNHFCSRHISMRTWKKLAEKLEWEESMHIPHVEYAWKQKFASRHHPDTHIKIHIVKIPILKFRTPFWHYQDNPLTPSIHCQDTIDSQLSIFNKENLYGWWVDDSFRKYYHFVAPSCKLELARFSAELRIQDGARVWQKLNVRFS